MPSITGRARRALPAAHQLPAKGNEMNGYKAFYSGRTLDLHAATLLEAKNKAVEAFTNKQDAAELVRRLNSGVQSL